MSSTTEVRGVHHGAYQADARLAWGLVGLLWIAYFLNYVDRQLVFSIFPALRRDLHFSNAQLGLAGSIFLWVYALCIAVSGRLADVIPRQRVVVLSLTLWSLTTIASGLSSSVTSFLFWRGAMGVTESLYMPAAVGLIATLHTGGTRAKALSLHSTAQFMGIAASGSYGGWMADNIGWRYGFYIVGAIGIAYAPVLFAASRRLRPLRVERSRVVSSPIDIFRSHCYLAHLFAFFMFTMILWMLYAWLPNFIYERHGLSMTQSGFTATVYLQTSSVIGVISGGVFADWLARRVPASRFYVGGLGLLLCAPCAYLTLAVPTLGWLKLCTIAFGLFAGLMVANNYACIYDVLSERNYSFSAGFLNLIGGLTGGIATFVAGLWKDTIGIRGLMEWAAWGAAIGAVAQIVVAMISFRRDRKLLDNIYAR